ncbi:MAG: DNA methyltransferase [Rhodobacteraceae bacterium]|nr:DNA methyltransferase [Paracoccaceae bacterium]
MGKQKQLSKSWDFGDTKEDLIHRIHHYPARFPAFITTRALEYSEQYGVKVENVADVFCGCGTTAVEAKRNGKNFWGCDLNPVATLIAQTKTHYYRDSKLDSILNQILEYFYNQPKNSENLKFNERISYWFNDTNMEDLNHLKNSIYINTFPYSAHRKFFLCAFSAILKPTSYWLGKSIKPQVDPNKKPREVIASFEKQVSLMRRANQNNIFPKPLAKTKILTKNFLGQSKDPPRTELIVTSPPYVTSYDYADIHQLSTLWLGYATDYRQLRKNMLGNKYGVTSPDRGLIKKLGDSAWETYNAMNSIEKRHSYSIARYFIDLDKTVSKCWNFLSDIGMAVFVIGNTQYKDVSINNAELLQESMSRVGFHSIQRIKRQVSLKSIPTYRDKYGRFTNKDKHRKVYAEEFVIIGLKNKTSKQ